MDKFMGISAADNRERHYRIAVEGMGSRADVPMRTCYVTLGRLLFSVSQFPHPSNGNYNR